jgi:hypothetical protein
VESGTDRLSRIPRDLAVLSLKTPSSPAHSASTSARCHRLTAISAADGMAFRGAELPIVTG